MSYFPFPPEITKLSSQSLHALQFFFYRAFYHIPGHLFLFSFSKKVVVFMDWQKENKKTSQSTEIGTVYNPPFFTIRLFPLQSRPFPKWSFKL